MPPGKIWTFLKIWKVFFWKSENFETFEKSEFFGRITDRLVDHSFYDDLKIMPINPDQDRVMICGSLEFNNDLKKILIEYKFNEGATNNPGEFVLGTTFEKVSLSNKVVARLEGKSSLGRIGLLIHSTAGFVDPGFSGYLTLELSNVANLPIKIYPEMKIGQISFYYLNSPSESEYGSETYGSKYQGQEGPTPSKSHTDFKK